MDEIKARGQPLEAEALIEAVNLHLDDAVSVHRGRTSLRDTADPEEYQLGLSEAAQQANPTEPVDDEVSDTEAASVADD